MGNGWIRHNQIKKMLTKAKKDIKQLRRLFKTSLTKSKENMCQNSQVKIKIANALVKFKEIETEMLQNVSKIIGNT